MFPHYVVSWLLFKLNLFHLILGLIREMYMNLFIFLWSMYQQNQKTLRVN